MGGVLGGKGERTMLHVGASAGSGRFCNVARAFSAANCGPDLQFPTIFCPRSGFRIDLPDASTLNSM